MRRIVLNQSLVVSYFCYYMLINPSTFFQKHIPNCCLQSTRLSSTQCMDVLGALKMISQINFLRSKNFLNRKIFVNKFIIYSNIFYYILKKQNKPKIFNILSKLNLLLFYLFNRHVRPKSWSFYIEIKWEEEINIV